MIWVSAAKVDKNQEIAKCFYIFMRDFSCNYYIFMRDFLGNLYTFMRDFPKATAEFEGNRSVF